MSATRGVDIALKLERKAAKRPAADDDASKRQSTFPGRPRHVEGQLGLLDQTPEGTGGRPAGSAA